MRCDERIADFHSEKVLLCASTYAFSYKNTKSLQNVLETQTHLYIFNYLLPQNVPDNKKRENVTLTLSLSSI